MIFLKYFFRHHKLIPAIIFVLISVIFVLNSEKKYISKSVKDMLSGAVISIMISMFFETYKVYEKYATHKNILKKLYAELGDSIEIFFTFTNKPFLWDMASYNETVLKKMYNVDLMESSIQRDSNFINTYQKVLSDYNNSCYIKDTHPRNPSLMQNQFNVCQNCINEHTYKQVSSIYHLVMLYTENTAIINNLYEYKSSIDSILFTNEKYLSEVNYWYLMNRFIKISMILRPLLNDEASLLGNDDYNFDGRIY